MTPIPRTEAQACGRSWRPLNTGAQSAAKARIDRNKSEGCVRRGSSELKEVMRGPAMCMQLTTGVISCLLAWSSYQDGGHGPGGVVSSLRVRLRAFVELHYAS